MTTPHLDDLSRRLAHRTPEELVELICRLIERQPDLEALLDLPTARERASARPIDPRVIQQQVRHAFAADDDDGSVGDSAYELQPIIELGDQYAAQSDWPNAAIVYETVLRGVLQSYGAQHDDSGSLIACVSDCVRGLERCLTSITDPDRRQSLLRVLFDTFVQDTRLGGVGLSDAAYGLLLEHTSLPERAVVAGWAQSAMAQAVQSLAGFDRRALGGLILNLLGDVLDDEEYLRLCREAGLTGALVDRLLRLDRNEEALSVAPHVSDYDLLSLAELFLKHDRRDTATRLVRERVAASRDMRLSEWLKKQAAQRGDLGEALDWAQQILQTRPTLEHYQDLRSAAQACDRWDEVRAHTIAWLTAAQDAGLLTEIYLLEDDIDAALAAVEKVKASWYSADDSLRLKVARAAEAQRPLAALNIYRIHVALLIEHRNRTSYAAAAQHLIHIRQLYERLHQLAVWQQYFEDLRERRRTLRAFQDELNRAGL